MKKRASAGVLGICVLMLGVLVRAAPSGRQEDAEQAVFEAVRDFYKFHLAHDMGFTAPNIKDRSRWFHPAFLKMLLEDRERNAAWVKAHPDLVPTIDGDPFTDSQEYPNGCDVRIAWIAPPKAEARAKMLWLDKEKGVTREREIGVVLEKDRGRWLISDVLDSRGRSLRSLLAPKT